MKQLVLGSFDMTWMTNFALILFFSLFIGMLIWIFRRSSKELYSRVEQIPLEEGFKNER